MENPLECLADVTYIFSWRPLQESVLSLIHRDKINKQRAFDILNQYHKTLYFIDNNLSMKIKIL